MWIIEFKNKGARKWDTYTAGPGEFLRFETDLKAYSWLCGQERKYHTRLRNTETGEIVPIPNRFR